VKRLAGLFLFFSVTVGGPISYVTFDPLKDVSAEGAYGGRGVEGTQRAVEKTRRGGEWNGRQTTPFPRTRARARAQPAEFLLATSVGSLFVVAVACLRIFLGGRERCPAVS
jgi:hypothetical protein